MHDDDVLGMPPKFVAELLAEGTKTQDELKDALRKVSSELAVDHVPSDESLRRLERIRANLRDVNSSFEMTRQFLEERGLTNVRQLDKHGMAELTAHLRLTLLAVRADNNPA
jgi:methionine aminopeptidase